MNTPLNIAFVDDERDIHTIFKAIFRTEINEKIVNIFSFSNGKECIDFLRDKKQEIEIILILSDLNMPIMDGFTLMEFIKKEFPHIEVYVISAYGSEEYIEKAKELGAEKFFVKPINFSALKKVILEKFLPERVTL